MKRSRGSSGLCTLPYFLWQNVLLRVLKLALWKVLELLLLPMAPCKLLWSFGSASSYSKIAILGTILSLPGGFKDKEEKKKEEMGRAGEDLLSACSMFFWSHMCSKCG